MTAPHPAFAGRCVVVTGAAGFIGSHVTRRLVRDGAAVHAMVRRRGSPRLADVRRSIVESELDVTDADLVRERFAEVQPEAVIHLAGETSARRFEDSWDALERSFEVNLRGTLNVLRAAIELDGVRVVVRTGGLQEYGTAQVPYHEAQLEQPVSPYSASQVAATHYCRMLQPHTSVTLVTLRPALVYGPGQSPDFFIPALIDSCLRDVDFEMTSGEQGRDLLHVDDLVEAIMLAVSRTVPGGAVINLGHGEEHRMVDVARLIVRLARTDARLRIGARPNRAGDLDHLFARNDLAASLLEWHPRVALADGIARTVEWYRAEMAAEVAR